MTLDDRPRFTRLVASNFLSLGEAVSVELGDLTVLVGINSAGKSNVVSALGFVTKALDNGLENAVLTHRGFDALRRDGVGRRPVQLRYELECRAWSATYEIEVGGTKDGGYAVRREVATIDYPGGRRYRYLVDDGVLVDPPAELRTVAVTPSDLLLRVLGGVEDIAPLRSALGSVRPYAIYPRALARTSSPSVLPYLDEEGTNWASIVREVARGRLGRELRAALGRVTGDVDDLKVGQLGDNLGVQFRHVIDRDGTERHTWFDAGRESDGTLRVAGLLTALLQDPPSTLIAIEEPELTIHPGALPLVLGFIRMATDWSQVLVTTHSPELLDRVEPDEIRVVQRIAGVTSVAPIEANQLALLRERLMSPGELLRTEGLAPDDGRP